MLKRWLCYIFILGLTFNLAVGCTSPTKKPTSPTKPQKTASKVVTRISAVQYPPVPSVEPQNADNDFQRRVVVLVNIERQKVGHLPLVNDQLLDKGATAKAEDMSTKNYFGHTSPTYGSPFTMMNSFGVQYQAAGENIALGYKTPEQVLTGWMNSPGHRANILSTKFGKIGVGFAKGNYWTQWFTD